MEARWLVYGLGSGWGHLNRAIALARKAPCPIEILVNSRYAPVIQASGVEQQITLHLLPHSITSPQEAGAYVKTWMAQSSFTHFVVDTFPRGLVGELVAVLPQLKVPKILVHRDLKPHYIAAKNLERFVQEQYDLVLIPGDRQAPLAHLHQACQTAPWLMREPGELWQVREPLQQRLQLPSQSSVIIVCATGQPAELEIFGQITQQLTRKLAQHHPTATVRCLAHGRPPACPPEQWIAHWPGLEILQFADVVVGAAGYNITYECAALGVPLVSLPMERKYDRQAKRAAAQSIPVTSVEGCVQAVEALLAKPRLRIHPRAWRNGGEDAIALISALPATP